MFAKLTRMTWRMLYFITTDRCTMTKDVDGSGARMTKMVMPEVGGDGEASVRSGRCSGDGVMIANTIAAKHHTPGRDTLDRKTKSVKFDRAIVVPSELMN
jgi:hypothetical protein